MKPRHLIVKGGRGFFIMETVFTEKRKFRRVRFKEAVHYQLRERSKFGGCLASDLSEGGIKLTFNEFVPLNTEMVVQVKLENIPKVVDLTGRAVWVHQIPYSDSYRVGLEFLETNLPEKEEIQSYIRARRF